MVKRKANTQITPENFQKSESEESAGENGGIAPQAELAQRKIVKVVR